MCDDCLVIKSPAALISADDRSHDEFGRKLRSQVQGNGLSSCFLFCQVFPRNVRQQRVMYFFRA